MTCGRPLRWVKGELGFQGIVLVGVDIIFWKVMDYSSVILCYAMLCVCFCVEMMNAFVGEFE